MEYQFEQHIREDSLELYSLGTLDEAQTETLEEHLLICEGCQVRLADADRYVLAMRSAAASLREKERTKLAAGSFWERFRMPTVAWAGAAVAICTVLFVTTETPSHSANGAMATVALTAERGEAVPVPANRKLDLQLDARGLNLAPQVRLELVDANGATLETATASEVADKVELRARQELSPGSYYVRIYNPDSKEAAREFALQVK